MGQNARLWHMSLVFLLIVGATVIAGCEKSLRPEPVEKPLHLYVLAGQSNMAGRGQVGEIDSTEHPRVFALKADMTWGPAREPLHFDKPSIIGVGPGFAFARAMAATDTTVLIGLIPTAVGGSSIKAWQPGEKHHTLNARPYDDAVSRVFRVLALHGGELKGVIWHQGESDTNSPPDEYLDDLRELVIRFRTEFQSRDLPFVAANLAEYYTARAPGAIAINDAITKLPTTVPFAAVVSADGFTHKGDSVHLSTESARELGERFAKAMATISSAGQD
jgi:hypothetical protein